VDLKFYLESLYPGLDEAGVWHVAKVVLNYDHFRQEPLVTKAMGISSRNCEYCKREQEESNHRHVFCRRHLMLYELKRYYVTEASPVFVYRDLYIFPQKYAVKWFENVVVSSFSSRYVSKKDVYYLLKFSFLKRDLREVTFSNLINIDEIDTQESLSVSLATANLIMSKDNRDGFVVSTFDDLGIPEEE